METAGHRIGTAVALGFLFGGALVAGFLAEATGAFPLVWAPAVAFEGGALHRVARAATDVRARRVWA